MSSFGRKSKIISAVVIDYLQLIEETEKAVNKEFLKFLVIWKN